MRKEAGEVPDTLDVEGRVPWSLSLMEGDASLEFYTFSNIGSADVQGTGRSSCNANSLSFFVES